MPHAHAMRVGGFQLPASGRRAADVAVKAEGHPSAGHHGRGPAKAASEARTAQPGRAKQPPAKQLSLPAAAQRPAVGARRSPGTASKAPTGSPNAGTPGSSTSSQQPPGISRQGNPTAAAAAPPRSKQAYVRYLRARLEALGAASKPSLPASMLRDPNVDTYELDPKNRWSEWRDGNFYAELARGAGMDYVETQVDPDSRRSWPSIAGLPLTGGGPRIEAPPLQRPTDPGDAAVTVFWHLTDEGLEAILTGQVAPAPSATSDPTLSPAAGEAGEGREEGTDRAAQRDGEGAGEAQEEEEDFGYAAWRSKLDPYVVAKAAEAQEMARERREMARQGAGAAGDVPEEEGGGAAHGKAALTSAQRLAAAARKLRQTLAEVYAVDSSVLVYAPRSLLDRPVGPPDDLTIADVPESPSLGIPWLPGDVPVPGGLDKLQRLQHIRSLNSMEYSPSELLDMIGLFEAAEEARKGAGKAGSRGTAPRPEPFNPWDWLRQRRKDNLEQQRRRRDREQDGAGAQRGTGGMAAAGGGGDRGTLGLGLGVGLGLGLRERGQGMALQRAGLGGLEGGADAAVQYGGTEDLSEEEKVMIAEEEVYRLLEELGPDPVMGMVKKALIEARDEEEQYRRSVEEREGVPYELAHLKPGLRRLGLDVEGMLDAMERRGREPAGQGADGGEGGRGRATGAGRDAAAAGGGPGGVQVEGESEAEGRQGGGRRGRRRAKGGARGGAQQRQQQGRAEAEAEAQRRAAQQGVHVPGQEPPPPGRQAVLTVGDILELSAVRLRRLPAGLEAQGVPAGQTLVQELQAFARRQAMRAHFNPQGLPSGRCSLACVVSDDPFVLQQLPRTVTSDMETIIVTSDVPMGLLAVPLDAVPLLLSWPAVLEGWYLQGSALLSRRVAERQVPPGRGFKTSQVERVRRQRLRLEPEEDVESDPAFAQFLRRMEVKEEDEGDEEQRGRDNAADEL